MFKNNSHVLKNLAIFLDERKQNYKQILIIFAIILLLSKEVIVNDYEIVIIYTLLTFLILLYFYLKELISQIFEKLINDIKDEYQNLSYILLTIEKNIIMNLSTIPLIYHFQKKIYFLTFKYLNNINRYIVTNIIQSNSTLMKLSLLKVKINLRNNQKHAITFLSKINNLVYFEFNKLYLSDNKQFKNSD